MFPLGLLWASQWASLRYRWGTFRSPRCSRMMSVSYDSATLRSNLMSRDDGSCCSTGARGSSDAREVQVHCASRRAGISARCCLSCCHTSSDEGADGFHTWRSVMVVRRTEVFHSIKTMLRNHTRRLPRGIKESYRYKEVRPKV